MREKSTSVEDTVEPLVRQLLGFINDTPPLLSLLYDLDWMPEQLERGSRDWFRMLMLAGAWKDNMPNARPLGRRVSDVPSRPWFGWFLPTTTLHGNNSTR